jgi:chlorite dismutase
VGEILAPSVGWGVLHLFLKVTADTDREGVIAAVKAGEVGDQQVVAFSVFGHKADIGILALGPDWERLRRLQSALQSAGLELSYSYVSLTELSEYSGGLPEDHLRNRLYPSLPPDGKRAICFYPMSKRRASGDNWYILGFDERKQLMIEHGKSGRRFAGRVLQLITGSTGLDDYEWGVTLFGVHPDDLKDTIYTMRFDEASARFAEFGPFYTGVVSPIEEVVAQVGLG